MITEEHRNKLREAKLKNPTRYWLGKKRPEMIGHKYNVGKTPWNKGKHWSEEIKDKLRAASKGKRRSPKTEFVKGMIPKNFKGFIITRVMSSSGIKLYKQVLVNDHPYGKKSTNNRAYIYEHRLVMEQSLGRLLHPGEVVHHINGDTLDNSIENLQLFSSPGQHAKLGHNNNLHSKK